MRLALLTWAFATSGCGYALMQTAHTEPPSKVGAAFGATYLTNELSGVAGRDVSTAIGSQIAPRIGVSDHVDVGLQPWLLIGARADVKVDLLDPLEPWAIAPRAGLGYAVGDDTQTAMALAGGIASYRVTPGFEPYVGATFADHWIKRPSPDVQLAPGESLASRTYVGDGLVQLNAGFELRAHTGVGMFLEYGIWLPAQNDPGDGYAFVTTHVFAIGVHVFSPRHGEFP